MIRLVATIVALFCVSACVNTGSNAPRLTAKLPVEAELLFSN